MDQSTGWGNRGGCDPARRLSIVHLTPLNRAAVLAFISLQGPSHDFPLPNQDRLYARRVAGCDRDHRRAGGAALARGASRSRSGPPLAMLEPPAADGAGAPQL